MKEFNHVVKGLNPVTDAFSGTKYSDIINMEDYGHIQFLILKGVGTTGTSTITIEACDDVSGTNSEAVPFRYQAMISGDTPSSPIAATTDGFTTTAGSSQLYKIEVDDDVMGASGYGYIRLKSVEVVDSPVLGCVLVILTEGRYKDAVPTTAIV